MRYNYHTVLRCVSEDPVDTYMEVKADISRGSISSKIVHSQVNVDNIRLVLRDIFKCLYHSIFESFETPSVDNLDVIVLGEVVVVKRPHDGVSNEDSFDRSGPTAV